MHPELAIYKTDTSRRTVFVLVTLYVLYGLLALPIVLASRSIIPLMLLASVGLPLFILGFFYWSNPAIIGWLTKIKWTGPDILPDRCRTFLHDLCATENIRNLRVGTVDTSLPNAFVFGRSRSPYLAVTKGLIDALPDDELNAVLAHEIGHIKNRDYLVLALAMVVPMILYRAGWKLLVRGGGSNIGASVRALGLIVLCFSWVSRLVYLVLSRAREFYADTFSATATGDPDSLARALVQITYGVTMAQAALDRQQNSPDKQKRRAAEREAALLRPVAALGIVNLSRPWLQLRAAGGGYGQVTQLMKWDVTNRWALLSQAESSHPLTTFRIDRLNKFTLRLGSEPSIEVPPRGERSWNRFAFDFSAYLAPYLGLAASLLGSPIFFFIGCGYRLWYRYRGKERTQTAAELIDLLEASPMNPIRVRISGVLQSGDGFGVTGAVLVDATGAVPLSISLWSMVARLRLPAFIGQQVSVSGWYRRGESPWLEPLQIEAPESAKILRIRTKMSKLLVLVSYLVSLITGWIIAFLAHPNPH